MKKILSLILSFTMAMLCFNVNMPSSNAGTEPSITIADVTGNAGDTVDVDIEISNNPGIIAISFDVEYDTSKLKLVKAEDEKLLGTSTSVFGKDLSANPYRLCWDDLSDSNNEQNGVLATLTFEILEDATGEAEIGLILNQGSTFNIDFEDVKFAVSGCKVNIGPETEVPANDAMLSIADVTGNVGETFAVDVEISNNPGIIALSFDVKYDASKIKLVKAEDKKLLGTSTSVFGKDLSANPYRLCWDDLSDSNNEQNGVLATLTFEILENATGSADIDLILNQGSTFNIDFEDVEFSVSGGKVNIGTVTTTTTTKSSTTTTKATTTTTKPITTTTVINPTTDAMLSIADVTGEAGETVEVEVEISNNPGIVALSFDVEYDASKIKLVKAEDEKILGTSTSVFGNDLSANPYRLCWDDHSDKNNEENGVLATLTFEILEGATGEADIDLILNQGSTFNIDFEDVEFAISGGKVNIGESATTTTYVTTTTVKPPTTTTTATTTEKITTTITTTTITTTTTTSTTTSTSTSTTITTTSITTSTTTTATSTATSMTTTTPPTTTEMTYMLGDVNEDGMVDSSDASKVLQEYALIQTGGEPAFTEKQMLAADVNKDNSTDASDASKILAYYAMVSTGKKPTWD